MSESSVIVALLTSSYFVGSALPVYAQHPADKIPEAQAASVGAVGAPIVRPSNVHELRQNRVQMTREVIRNTQRSKKSKQDVHCFGLDASGRYQELATTLSAFWSLPLKKSGAQFVVGKFSIASDGTITNPQISQSCGDSAVDASVLLAIQDASHQMPGTIKLARDTVVFATFSYVPKGELPSIVRAAEADVLCALKTTEDTSKTRLPADAMNDDDDYDPDELDESEAFDPWTLAAARVCRAAAADINKCMQTGNGLNTYLPVTLSFTVDVEVGPGPEPIKFIKKARSSGSEYFDKAVEDGIHSLNLSNSISIPRASKKLTGRMTVHLIELISH